jgi:glycyl-tRNA synthetase beta subunit
MVNAEDPAERLNRLRLLGGLRALFTQVADLALLSSAAE